MSIQEHLNKIRNAVYGREVRESIAKGIETAYDDASEKDNANMEVKIARGTHPNLRSRLEEVDDKQQQTTAQLEQKVGDGKKAELEDLSSNVLLAIEGGEGASFNLLSIPQDKSVSHEKTTFIRISSNRFDKANVRINKRIDPTTGQMTDNATTSVSNDIPIKPNTPYTSNGEQVRWCFYDNTGAYKGSQLFTGGVTYTPPTGTAILKLAIPNQFIDTFQFNEGTSLLTYENYYRLLDEELIPESESNQNPFNLSLVDVPSKYNAPTEGLQHDGNGLGQFNPYTENNTSNMSPVIRNVSEIYALFDALVSENPNYMSSRVVGRDATNSFDIKEYEANPERPYNAPSFNARSAISAKLPKILISTATHGHESIPVHCLYWMMYGLCNNWKSSEAYEYLRWNVNFKFIPLVNPWGYSRGVRTNGNLVDINRNMEYKWNEFTSNNTVPLLSTYKGTAPLSEPETRALNNFFKQNTDALYYADFHDNAGNSSVEDLFWTISTDKHSLTPAVQTLGVMSRLWKKEIPEMDESYQYYGWVSTSNGPQTVAQAAYIHGISSAIPEMFRKTGFYSQDTQEMGQMNLECFIYTLLNVLSYAKDNY